MSHHLCKSKMSCENNRFIQRSSMRLGSLRCLCSRFDSKTNRICFSAIFLNLVNILSQLPTNLGTHCTLFDAIAFLPLRLSNHINIGNFEWKQPEVHWHTTNQFLHFGHRSVSSNNYPSYCCVVAVVFLLRFESFNIDTQSNREWEWVVRVRERRSIGTERGRALAKWKWSCS